MLRDNTVWKIRFFSRCVPFLTTMSFYYSAGCSICGFCDGYLGDTAHDTIPGLHCHEIDK